MLNTACSNVVYDKDLNAVICTWINSCSPKDFHDSMLYGLDLLIKTGGKTWITDVSAGVEVLPNDPEWFANTFLPKTIYDSVENLYFIIRPECKVKKDVEEMVRGFSEFLNTKMFSSYEELKEELIKL
ncbi:hypothetical protein KKA17_00420 [bacterium]|nr:hypothetical protein [bacterium]MBU1883686.1 hypothetical protein [bacterium]